MRVERKDGKPRGFKNWTLINLKRRELQSSSTVFIDHRGSLPCIIYLKKPFLNAGHATDIVIDE